MYSGKHHLVVRNTPAPDKPVTIHIRPPVSLAATIAAFLLAGCGSSFWVPPPPSPSEIPRLEQAHRANPEDPATSIRLSQAYRAADRIEDARLLLERAVERHPDEPMAAFLLGVTYEDLGLFSEARRLYHAYIEEGSSPQLRSELERRLPLLQRRELEVAVRDALERETELANTPPRPNTLAVFPFRFVGEDPEYRPLGRALAELLVTDLSQTSRLQVLERAHVQLLIDEMRLAETGRVDPRTAARTGRILGAERVVHGSLAGGEEELRLETSIIRVTDAAAVAGGADPVQLSETDALARLIDMQNRLALRIYSTLGVQLTAAERERVNQRPTENILALLAFGRGLEAEDAGDFAAAARHFAESAGLDPEFAAARTFSQRVSAVEAAEGMETSELAARADTETTPTGMESEGMFLPDPMGRDAAAEILRTEGIASPTILELIFRRP